MSGKIDDLLDQKVEDQAHFMEYKYPILEAGKIPSSYFFISQATSFYCQNFFRTFLFCSLYFAIGLAIFAVGLIYPYSKIFCLAAILILLIIYCFVLANIVIDEEEDVLLVNKQIWCSLVKIIYSFLVFITVLLGGAILSLVPELLMLNFFGSSSLLNIVGGAIFAILFIIFVVWYALFLFVVTDEKEYGFKALVRSKKYVEVNFFDYLWHLAVCLAMIPIIFTLATYTIQGVVVMWDVFDNLFSINYNMFGIKNSLASVFDLKDIIGYLGMFRSWFIAIFLVIPFAIIYLGFLYSSLSCQKPLHKEFSGSLFDKIILRTFATVGVLEIAALIIKLLR